MLSLSDVKAALRVTHNLDDGLISRLLSSAEAECQRFCNLDALPSELPADMAQGIIVMIQSDYDADPAKRHEYRRAAESLWMPYRELMGI